MTLATLTPYQAANYPGLKKGVLSAQNGYTSTFGFKNCRGAVLTVDDDNDAIVTLTAITAGVGTIGINDDANAAVAAATKIYYLAWGD